MRVSGFVVIAVLAAGLMSCAESRRDEAGTSQVFAHPMSRTWPAIEQAVSDLDFRFEENRHDELGGTLRARRASGNDVLIHAQSPQRDRTTVSVSAPSGDRSTEEAILRRIAGRLDAHQPPAAK